MMMMTLEDRLTEDRRLVMLRVLDEAPGCSANESILQDILVDFGHRVSRDYVKTQMHWLREQGLIRLESVRDYLIATIAARGSEAVKGYVVVPGVKRPTPK